MYGFSVTSLPECNGFGDLVELMVAVLRLEDDPETVIVATTLTVLQDVLTLKVLCSCVERTSLMDARPDAMCQYGNNYNYTQFGALVGWKQMET